MSRARTVLAVAAALAAGAAVATASCRREEPAAETRLLVVDGLEITLADVEPYVAFLDSYLPEVGRKTKVAEVLDQHVIPVRLAQRAFAEQRQQARERAAALRAIADNVAELEQQSGLVTEKSRAKLTRKLALLPVAMYAFEPEQAPLRVGSVSQPIELPHGFVLVGVHDLQQSPGMRIDDYVDVLQVGFVTHSMQQWLQYYNDEKRRLAGKVTFVHPDYVHALPDWLR